MPNTLRLLAIFVLFNFSISSSVLAENSEKINSGTSLFDTLKELSDSTLQGAAEVTKSTTNWMSDKFKGSVEQFDHYKVVIEESGFKYSGVTVDIGFGGLDFYFVRDRILTETQQNELLKKYENERISSFLLKTIFEAPETLSLEDHIVKEVAISFLSIPPKMSLSLVPLGERGEISDYDINDYPSRRIRRYD